MARLSRLLRINAFWGFLLAILLAACVRYEEPPAKALKPPKAAKMKAPKPARETPAAKPGAPSPTAATKAAAPAREAPKATYSATHDAEIKEIFSLAESQRWEEAEARVNALIAHDPQEPGAQRLLSWVKKQRELRRDQALEDRIREIDANSSAFNPTVPGLLRESKDRGLPPRRDVRDVVQQIQSTPYIPESFGRTNHHKGLLFELESAQGQMAKVLEKEISVHLDNATLESIIFNIGQAEGINFVADKALPAFKQTLSVNMGKVKLGNFLRYVSRNLDLQFQVGDDLIWIVDAKDKNKMLEVTRFYRLRKGFVLPAQLGPPEVTRTTATVNNVTTVTEVQKMAKFVNDLAPLTPSIERAITNFFTGSKYFIDYEHNLIVARGTPDQLEVMDRIVQEFDQPIQQVLIEAKFITVAEATFLKLGIAWETGRDLLTAKSTSSTDFTGQGLGEVGLGLQETRGNILSRKNLSATLTAIQQSGESHVLSAPRLTVINNLPATIQDGKVQYYYEEYQVKQQILERRSSSQLVPAGRPVKLTSGVTLQVLASIGGDGKTIFLALNPQVNQDVQLVPFATITDKDETGRVVSTFDIRLPESRTQDLATRVIVRSGQTVVMGGVLERQQTTFVESVPILGNIPIIGAAFRRRTELDKPRYLLIFVTATLLSETGEFLIYDEEEPAPEKTAEKK
jgi:type IV pilus assembly protein PilQ